MDLATLRMFLAVAEERSFSRAAAKVHRTQPAVSQAVRRLESDLGEQLFDRSSKSGTLTDAGRVLQNYGQRLVRLAEETESAMRELRDLRRGRVLIGANEAAMHTLLPLMARFRQRVPDIAVDVRRVPARQIAVEVQQGSLDFGALTFRPLGDRPARGGGRQRRARPARPALASVGRPPAGHDGGSGERAGRRAQRSLAGARTRAAAVRAASHPAEDGDCAAEPRRHQAGRGAEARGRAAPAPLRASPRSRADGSWRCRWPASPAGVR